MRKIYILLAVITIVTVLLVVFAFLFFEKEKHKSFFYTVEIGGEKVGEVEIDYYKTEDKIIYKSVSFRPKALGTCKITHEKIVFARSGFKMEKFAKECKNFGTTTEVAYIRNNNGAFDFMAKAGSKFSAVSGITHAKNISVFDQESMVTYMPIVDKYNFSRGGAQSFNVLYHFLSLLPPARGKIIFTSIRDEYINVDGKKTKTECLVVRAKTLPETYIWVSKKARCIVRLKIKSKALLMKRVNVLKKISIEDYRLKGQFYGSRDIIFPSEDIALAGTIEIPHKEGKLPSVLLVAGEGPYNRENAGLYTDISHELAENGYIVLCYDKRGMGKSQGDYTAVSLSTEIKDIENALKFLSNYEGVDKDNVFIVGHGAACSYLPELDFSKLPVKGIIMLGVNEPAYLVNFKRPYVIDKIKVMTAMDQKYPETLDLAKGEVLNLIKAGKKEYAFMQGRRVFLMRMREILGFDPLEGFKKLDVPLMLIYGKKDRFGSLTYLKNIEKTLKQIDPQRITLIYFRPLGHFFGEIVREKNKVMHYSINKKVLEAIKGWLGKRCADISTLPQDSESIPSKAEEKAEGLTNE